MTVQDHLMYQPVSVTDVVFAASAKLFSSLDHAQLYVLSKQMETSSESHLRASQVKYIDYFQLCIAYLHE